MNEHFDNPELDTLEAERIIFDTEPKMWSLLREFNAQSRAFEGFEYGYIDENDQLRTVWFTGKNNGKSRDYILATNRGECFKVSFVTQLNQGLEPDHSLTMKELAVYKEDRKSHDFAEGGDSDLLDVAEMFRHFDASELRAQANDAIMRRKTAGGRKLFRMLSRKD
jgi:hypothetical protein